MQNDDQETAINQKSAAPFDFPFSKRKWYLFLVLGTVFGFLVMGIVNELTRSSLLGPISVAEAVGFAFLFVWYMAGIGPLSPFRVNHDQ